MAKAPGVVLEKSGGQVRLRGMKHALPVCLDIEGKGQVRVSIAPNKWTKVPDEIYEFLQTTFDTTRYTEIPDVEANQRNPHAPGEQPIMTQEEVDPQFFLEFRN